MRRWLRALPLIALLPALGCTPTGDGAAVGLSDEAGGGCAPGARRPADDGCNACVCGADGAWSCTDLACAEACTPGDFHALADGCNTCTCAPDGAWICTAGECAREPVEDPDAALGCAPGERGQDDAGCPCVCDAGEWQCGCDGGGGEGGEGGEPPSPGGPGDCAPDAVRAGECGGVCWCADGGWICDRDCDDDALGQQGPDADRLACETDADCAPTGCGGQICAAVDAAVECAAEADAPAACYSGEAAVTGCGCVQGQCGWQDLSALAACAQAEASEGAPDPAP